MSSEDTTVIARTVARTVVPIILLTAVSLLLQGHNLPGGGFIAGVLTAAAFVLLFIIYGLTYLEETVLDTYIEPGELRPGIVTVYRDMFAFGLALAAGSGLVAVAAGESFLEQGYVVLHDVPLYGELEFASALAFDVGVYFVVVGALLTIVAVVGQE